MTLITRFDRAATSFARKHGEVMARLSLFTIYFWFGALKIFDLSPANPLVQELLNKTMTWISFDTFIVLFGLLEVLIGVLFLFRDERISHITIAMMWLHMAMTVLPLFVLPQIAWSAPLVPTLEGQYVIKNIALIALTIQLLAHMHKKSTV